MAENFIFNSCGSRELLYVKPTGVCQQNASFSCFHFCCCPVRGKNGGEGGIFHSGVRSRGAGAPSRRPAVDGDVIPEPCQPLLWKRRQPGMASGSFLMPAGNTCKRRHSCPSFPAGASEISSHVLVVLPRGSQRVPRREVGNFSV